LFRTELLFLSRQELPSEEDHTQAYDALIAALSPGMPACLRTFDIGSDKMAAWMRMPKEHNPALGLRACRLGLQRPQMLRAQLRGMLRATSSRRGSVLLPMIGSVDELVAVKDILHDEMDKLEELGVPVWREVPLGVMIELPAAVWIADQLAKHCDFFSVGTNDLIQYSLAIDRANENVAYLYQPLHAGLLRSLAHVVTAANAAKIPVSLCGEMASDPMLAPICMGLGFDSLSMPYTAIPRVKWVLRRFGFEDARALVQLCSQQTSAREVERALVDAVAARVPEALDVVQRRGL
jgi:phosphotransferase system enzyme I (PtsI)